MFWGLVLEPNKTYAQVVDTPFHVSMAALDLKNADAQEEASTLILRQDDVEYVLGNLSKRHKIFNVPLGLDFDLGEEIEFAVQGQSQIHLTGFLADNEEDMEELTEEEESEVNEKIKDIKKAEAAKRKLTDADKSPGNVKKQKILDESFNDDSDEDDFDITENDFDSDDIEDSDVEEEEEDDDEDDDDEDDDEEVPPKLQKLPQANDKQKKQKQANKQGTPQQQSNKGNQQQQQSAKKGNQQQQQFNKKGNQEQQHSNKQGGQQSIKSPQKQVQSNKTPQKSPQPNKNQQKTPQPGAQGNKTPQQGNGLPAPAKSQKKVVKGVVIEDVAQGSGKVASANKKVGVYYVGRLAKNKKEFDKNVGGEPFKFVLGRKEVIPGWDIGVEGMRVGGKRRLTIPANLAYGSRGAPPDIPPNSSLEFEVTLINVK